MRLTRALAPAIPAALVLLAACGSDRATAARVPARIVAVSGSGQSADLGQPLGAPLVVKVSDGTNLPVSGVAVQFTVSTGAGTLGAATATTDARGQASTTFTMGQTPGATTISAAAAALPGASAVFFVNTGPTIAGRVDVAPNSLRPAAGLGAPPVALDPVPARRVRNPSLDVAYRAAALGLPRMGTMVLASVDQARTVATGIRARLAAQPMAAHFVVRDVSPVIATARIQVTDPALRDSVIRALRADPAIASVTEDELLSRGPIAKETFRRALAAGTRGPTASITPGAGDLLFSGTQAADYQFWHYNLVDAPRAWRVTTGSSGVTVAVIDDGINAHPDIVANLDMAGGYDFVQNDSAQLGGPQPLCGGGSFASFDDDGTPGPDPDPTMPLSVSFDATNQCYTVDDNANHGLHVSGTIGAGGNPNAIVSGVNWTVRIRPIRALGIDGSGYTFDIAQAVLYAAGLPAVGAGGALVTAPNRAPIINMSLGGPVPDTTLGRAVASAIAAGSVIIASAGNSGSTSAEYPASYPGVIAVAALGPDGNLASYSTTGSTVSLVAPGGDFRFDDFANFYSGGSGGVLSTTWDFSTGSPDWGFYTGTSMAAPHVSGVAALVLAANPGLRAAQLRARLLSTAIDLGPVGPDDRYGYGLVDAYAAVTGQAPARRTYVRAIDAATGAVAASVAAAADGSFALTDLPAGSYYVVAGEDELADGVIGFPGRRFGWAGSGAPAPLAVAAGQLVNTSILIGTPQETLTNTDSAHAEPLFVDSWIAGSIPSTGGPNYFRVRVPAAGTYIFETSGVLGACGLALELNTTLTVRDSLGALVGSNDDASFFSGSATFPGRRCSVVTAALQKGPYMVQVGSSTTPAGHPGAYRLEVRSGG